MARNRAGNRTDENPSTGDAPPPDGVENPPGGEENTQDVPLRDRGRVERAIMHLEFLEEEIKELSDDRSSLVGVMRQTAAKQKNQLTTNTRDWPPLKAIRKILESVRDGLPPDE